jgi:hypothetical protein
MSCPRRRPRIDWFIHVWFSYSTLNSPGTNYLFKMDSKSSAVSLQQVSDVTMYGVSNHCCSLAGRKHKFSRIISASLRDNKMICWRGSWVTHNRSTIAFSMITFSWRVGAKIQLRKQSVCSSCGLVALRNSFWLLIMRINSRRSPGATSLITADAFSCVTTGIK